MKDIYQTELRGHVQTLKSEHANWDAVNATWLAPRWSSVTRFGKDGRVEELSHNNPDGSFSRSLYTYDEAGRLQEIEFRVNEGAPNKSFYRYDESGRLLRHTSLDAGGTEVPSEVWTYDDLGRKTKTQYVPKLEAAACGATPCGVMMGVDGAQHGYSAGSAVEVRTSYDERGLSTNVAFYDANDSVVLRISLRRDESGRLISEESQAGDTLPFSLDQLANQPSAEREEIQAALAQLYSPQMTVTRSTYRYDDRGLQVERNTSSARLSEARTTWQHDQYGNILTELQEETSHDLHMNSTGTLEPGEEKSHRRESRFDYKYDAQGNWIERAIWARFGEGDFQPSNIERREIHYW